MPTIVACTRSSVWESRESVKTSQNDEVRLKSEPQSVSGVSSRSLKTSVGVSVRARGVGDLLKGHVKGFGHPSALITPVI